MMVNQSKCVKSKFPTSIMQVCWHCCPLVSIFRRKNRKAISGKPSISPWLCCKQSLRGQKGSCRVLLFPHPNNIPPHCGNVACKFDKRKEWSQKVLHKNGQSFYKIHQFQSILSSWPLHINIFLDYFTKQHPYGNKWTIHSLACHDKTKGK